MYYWNLALEKFYLHGSVQKATYYQFLKVEFRDMFLSFVALILFSGCLFRFYTACHLSLAYSHTSYAFHYPRSTRTWHCTKASIRSTNCILPTGSMSIDTYPFNCLVFFPYFFAHPNSCQTSCSNSMYSSGLQHDWQSFNIINSSKPCLSGLVYVWCS